MTDTSLIFNILAKDSASQAFALLKIKATQAFDGIASRAKNFAEESVAAFEKGERSQLLLQDAFDKFPALADTNIEHLRAYNEQLQGTAKFDHNALAEGEAKLAMFKFTGKQIETLTPLMEDFASKTGMDLASAATTFGKAMVGQGRGLKQVGINFKDTGTQAGNYAELLQGLTEKVGGFAEKEGKTAAGQTAILKNEVEDLKEKIGSALVPVLLRLVPPLQKVLEFLSKHISVVTKVLAVVGSLIGILWALNAVVRAYTIVQMALNIVMSLNPIGLIIIAIAALIAIIIVVIEYHKQIGEFFTKVWGKIWGVIQEGWNWVKEHWPLLLAIFTGPVGLAVLYIVDHWNGILDFFKSIPGKIRALASGMWDGIVDSFKAAINWLIRLWNNFHLTIGGGSFSLFGQTISIPSITLNTPDIPYLDLGGYITRTGLAVVHRGETVVPAGRSAAGGVTEVHVILDSRTVWKGLIDHAARRNVPAAQIRIAYP